MKQLIVFLSFSMVFLSYSQEEEEKLKQNALRESKNLTWEGNKDLSENNFVEAEVDYRKAIAKSDENPAAPFNLGNAYYNKESFSEAFGRFKEAGESAGDKKDKHKAYHNMGNVFMKRKEYEKAVEAYKEALRNNPTDEETRYNLALAKEMLKKEQEEQKNDQNEDNKDNQDQKDKEEKNEDKEEGDNNEDKKDQGENEDQGEEEKEENEEGEGDEKEEQKKQPDQGDKPEEEEQQQPPRPNQLSKQQIQNLLEAMQNEEKKVQEKIDAQKVKGVKVKNEKDW
ncbi:tetratricopeptide repeat protein [Maribacter halichondriae]|uniref:tetratricopeptide repeat protein n=1 Tax=Maribacter halichondriae TaxID=2980554 RepID=UPI002359A6DA|nr:tetratricopeptide repeat protein [Maribacter sp. Hal144]